MDLFLVFNELSIPSEPHNPADTIYQAREWMTTFVDTLWEASRHRVKNLRTHRQFVELNLLSGYSLLQWLNDREVDQIARQYVKTKASKLPYLEDLPDIEDRSRLFDFKINSNVAHGCGAAYLLESIAISLPCRDMWNIDQLDIGIEELDETTADIKKYSSPIKHVSCADHVTTHAEWIQGRLQSGVQNGADLLKKASDWFSHIRFTDNAEEQINGMTSGTPQLRQVVIKLIAMEAYCSRWTSGGFVADVLLNVSRESSPVRDNPKLRGQRTFKCKDGVERFFEWHARLTPDEWRLHFFPDEENHIILVGYVGPHLPTAKY